MRLTLDRNIVARAAAGWEVTADLAAARSLLPDEYILELKFCETLPTPFRILLQDFALQPAAFSKYRTAVEHVIPLTALAANTPPG
jgi:hypothetical protein